MSNAKVVSFRAEPEIYTELAVRAKSQGQSVGEYARALVASGLTASKEAPSSSPGTDVLLGSIENLRQQLSKALEAIIVATKVLTPNEARELVERNFPKTP